ncbi:MAG: phosphoribosylformylglycinamidine synthase I [Chloroflexota bacterium]
MRFAVIVFPGTNCDRDTHHVLTSVLKQEADLVWHHETDLSRYDCLVLPGGFAHGDHLRAGAIARFSPVMSAVADFASTGRPVIGICNGFQVLLEAGLLPGAMLPNAGRQFRCEWVSVQVTSTRSVFLTATNESGVLRLPIAHGEGRYFASEATLAELERRDQIALRYCDQAGNVTSESNPNGSLYGIAGITNREGNVLGLMPHPERASELALGGVDGRLIFESVLLSVAHGAAR